MIKRRLKEIDFKITDLADYLKISRPTLYKYIESYDSDDYDSISKPILGLFRYIDTNPLVGKRAAINYILTNLVDEKELGEEIDSSVFIQIKKMMISDPKSSKTKFIKLIISSSDYNEVCDYLLQVHPLLRNRKPTEKEIEFLKPYDEIRSIMEQNKSED